MINKLHPLKKIPKNTLFSSAKQQKSLKKQKVIKKKTGTLKKLHADSKINHQTTTHLWKTSPSAPINKKTIELILWNVNGFRAIKSKGKLQELISKYHKTTDFICFNQTKIDLSAYEKVKAQLKGQQKVQGLQDYKQFWNFCKVSKGYSGVMTYSKYFPSKVIEDMPSFKNHSLEGRALTLQFDQLFVVNCYKPNSGGQLCRLDYRMQYEDSFIQFIKELRKKKPVIICADMNVANEEIDLSRPKECKGGACFTDEERGKFKQILSECGMVDAFRHLHPDKVKYSYWSYRNFARERNVGWRLDYILVDKRLKVLEADMLNEIYGSDHCPVKATIQLKQ